MIQQFEQLEKAVKHLETLIDKMNAEKERMSREIAELKGIVEDRDLEIMQLQEEAQKKKAETSTEKAEIENRLDALLGRVRAIAPEDEA